MSMTYVHQLFERLFPMQSTKRYARLLGINQRTVQRWGDDHDGGRPGPQVMETIQQQQRVLSETGFPDRLHSLVEDSRKAGLHDEIVGAWLAAEYQRISGSPVE